MKRYDNDNKVREASHKYLTKLTRYNKLVTYKPYMPRPLHATPSITKHKTSLVSKKKREIKIVKDMWGV
jgi:hypothetical protein